MNPILSFFGGAQLGLVHYRMKTSDSGVVGMEALAAGFQLGADVRLTSRLSLRFESSFLHADEASTTVTYGTTTYGDTTLATNFVHFNGAFCITF